MRQGRDPGPVDAHNVRAELGCVSSFELYDELLWQPNIDDFAPAECANFFSAARY